MLKPFQGGERTWQGGFALIDHTIKIQKYRVHAPKTINQAVKVQILGDK